MTTTLRLSAKQRWSAVYRMIRMMHERGYFHRSEYVWASRLIGHEEFQKAKNFIHDREDEDECNRPIGERFTNRPF